MKGCLTSLAIRELQLKTTMRDPIKLLELLKLKKKKKRAALNAGEDVEKLDHSYIVSGNVKCDSLSVKHFGSLFKKI